MKIAVIGYSGSGKSTTAKHLSEIHNIPALFLDTVQFLPNWVERELEESRKIVKDFMENPSWVIDGSYSKFYQSERLEQADQIVFLNFNRFVCLYRAFSRYLKNRGKVRENMAEGCTEKFDFEFFWWLIYEGRNKEKRKSFEDIKQKYPNKIVEIKNQKQLDLFLQNI